MTSTILPVNDMYTVFFIRITPSAVMTEYLFQIFMDFPMEKERTDC
jgi:hypothetical protein